MNALLRRRGMMQMGVNTTDSKKLVAEFTLSEDSNTINVEIPAEAQVYKLFVVVLNGETSASEWIYPAINRQTKNTNAGYYNPQKRVFSNWFVIAPYGYETASVAIPVGCSGASMPNTQANYPITNVLLHLYNASSTFKAGFNVKIYAIDI